LYFDVPLKSDLCSINPPQQKRKKSFVKISPDGAVHERYEDHHFVKLWQCGTNQREIQQLFFEQIF
jgi:hypothetical protein